MSLAPGYDPTQFEARLYAQWEASGVFKPSGHGEPYCILLPPPNVTGTLHMGHAFQHTLQDALVRYHRMRGFDVLWQMGTDHAGIATEMVVSRNLALEGKGETRDSLGRDGFIEKVWEWKQASGDTIERQMRRLGTSGDWSRSTFTMDPMAADAVREAFVRLFDDGLIYRGQRLVNWDPVLKTAISDLEVANEEEDGSLWSIRYPLADGETYAYVERDEDGNETLRETRDYLVVATTRPETMLGDTAAMVHPDDERYASLHGKSVVLPLTGRRIPVITDDYVDRAFGTGVVKVTPAHDFNDYAVGQRHSLPLINIFTPDAKILDGVLAEEAGVPEPYRGLDRFDARKAVLADLESQGLLLETRPHKLQVPRGDRTGQVIEPYLTDQWFVKMDTLGARGLQLAESGAVKFVPPNWINTYRHWMENIQDWCISRQLWWGHRIPAWYDATGRAYVGRDEAEVRAKHGIDASMALTQDNDVLETWFSSSLWPFSTMGWPNEALMRERGFDRFVPSSVLVTGFDIIFFWVARMIMMTDHFTGEVPFKDVYITGLVRDAHGQKMSKSKGNVLDPIDLVDGISLDDLVAKRTTGLMNPKDAPKIEKATRKEFPDGIPAFGADALRFTIAALATHGRDIKFDLNRAEGYKNFCNKLWNAARFVLMNTEGFSASGVPELRSDFDRWIVHSLRNTMLNVQDAFAAYRFDYIAQELYDFTWNELCDWYLEFSKAELQLGDSESSRNTKHVLLYVLEQTLRGLHPIIPFVTDEIWGHIAPRLGLDATTVSIQQYPTWESLPSDAESVSAASTVSALQAVVVQIRSIRSQLGISPGKPIQLLVQGPRDDMAAIAITRYEPQLKSLVRAESVHWIETEPPAAATAVLGDIRLFVPLEGLVDLGAERSRLDKEIKRVEVEIAKCRGKLASETFVANAPPAVVEQERKRLVDWTSQQDALSAQRAKLG
ncbi:valine--tRNA ligase [Cognatilysobacter lacus]|uniref:Valine--tRNA ligase n=1 Tax=Cognatilysobacter lacus TaxID=1643323 RepID=A0A5D8Z8L9_9GAMM|nr:valine--tRNA ligase [Lysobacter lacus]TZF91258.1 valine--tRNA ligase [Lysobacter lacus]